MLNEITSNPKTGNVTQKQARGLLFQTVKQMNLQTSKLMISMILSETPKKQVMQQT